MMRRDPIDALMDLVADDRSRITTAYFMISEDNVRMADAAAVGVASARTRLDGAPKASS